MATIVEVAPPTSADDPIAWAAVAENRLWNAENHAQLGYADLDDTEAAAVRMAMPSANRLPLRVVALDDPDDPSSAVGVGTCSLTLKDNLTTAAAHVVVRAERRREGIGTALLAAVERRAIAEGRTTLQSWATQVGSPSAGDPGVIAPREGSGHLDGGHPVAQFMTARGYTLEQIEVHSMLRVPVAPAVLDPLASEAAAKVGEAYRLITWTDACPDELVDGFARLRAAMDDAPTAGLQYDASHWDAERIREGERRAAEAGLVMLAVVAQHVASGQLVGFTQLDRYPERPGSAFQDDTVVVAEHRGHRLGMHLKVANLRRMDELWPDVRRIHTWNADENDYMRSINIALGFRPESNEGAWQKVVA